MRAVRSSHSTRMALTTLHLSCAAAHCYCDLLLYVFTARTPGETTQPYFSRRAELAVQTH